MEDNREALERSFEAALLEVLVQEYDLDVCLERDRLERRRRDVASLGFEYHYRGGAAEARVVISIQGARHFSNLLPVDFGCDESIRKSAESCEALARFIHEHLADARDHTLDEIAAGRLRYGRREEDLA